MRAGSDKLWSVSRSVCVGAASGRATRGRDGLCGCRAVPHGGGDRGRLGAAHVAHREHALARGVLQPIDAHVRPALVVYAEALAHGLGAYAHEHHVGAQALASVTRSNTHGLHAPIAFDRIDDRERAQRHARVGANRSEQRVARREAVAAVHERDRGGVRRDHERVLKRVVAAAHHHNVLARVGARVGADVVVHAAADELSRHAEAPTTNPRGEHDRARREHRTIAEAHRESVRVELRARARTHVDTRGAELRAHPLGEHGAEHMPGEILDGQGNVMKLPSVTLAGLDEHHAEAKRRAPQCGTHPRDARPNDHNTHWFGHALTEASARRPRR